MESEDVKKQKTASYVAITIFVVLVLILLAVIIFKPTEEKTKKEDKPKEEEKTQEEEKPIVEEEISTTGIDIGKLKGIVSFGVIETQTSPKNVTLKIVAYTKENKIINVYDFESKFLNNIVTEENIMYETPTIGDIDYSNNKLYILIHDEIYYINLVTNNNYKLEKINYKLESNYYDMYVLDDIIYLNDQQRISHVKYNLKTNKIESMPKMINSFLIKKDTKEIIYMTGEYDYTTNLYIAPINDIENGSKYIYSAPVNMIEYVDFDKENIYFSSQDDFNESLYVRKYNLKTKEITVTNIYNEAIIINGEMYYSSYADTLELYKYVDGTNDELIYKYSESSGYIQYMGGEKIVISTMYDHVVVDLLGNETTIEIYELDGEKKEISLSVETKLFINKNVN